MFAPYAQKKIVAHPRPEDYDDVRLGAAVTCWSQSLDVFLEQVKAGDVVIWGYPDDRGVDRNGGRTGALEGPGEIRKHLYSMTWHEKNLKKPETRIWDLGDFKSWSFDLGEAHEKARAFVAQIRSTGARLLSLGGGHDWAYADFMDLNEGPGKKMGHVVNVDAHLDMRPLPENDQKAWHSGTPFRRILGGEKPPRLSVLGLQKHCNALTHINWAQGARVSMLFLEDLPLALSEQLIYVLQKLDLSPGASGSAAPAEAQNSFALSVDMDAFPQSAAPGVSAPQSVGIDPMLVLSLIKKMGKNISQLGLYELCPRFDVDSQTARLSAKIAHAYICGHI